MVERFHVSLKLDGQRNPGVFSWVYNGVSDQYIAQTYGPPHKTKTWFGDQAIQDAILRKGKFDRQEPQVNLRQSGDHASRLVATYIPEDALLTLTTLRK